MIALQIYAPAPCDWIYVMLMYPHQPSTTVPYFGMALNPTISWMLIGRLYESRLFIGWFKFFFFFFYFTVFVLTGPGLNFVYIFNGLDWISCAYNTFMLLFLLMLLTLCGYFIF